jgi:hypothetical protein
MNKTHRFTIYLAASALFAATSAQASTVFLTNNTASKTLASNEGDAAALEGNVANDTTALTLSADDNSETINLTTISIVDQNGETALGMDADSMGATNDKWGNSQNWTFSFDQIISFDALDFKTINEDMTLQSTAWATDADATGSNWSFTSDGTLGTFSILGDANGPGTYDFTSAGVASVAADTAITFGFLGGAQGGEELTSFTISVVPEPSAFGLLAGCFGLTWVMLRRR